MVKTDFRKSAGIIVFRKREGKREYLLLEYGDDGHWDYAKGGIERGEDEKQAALRELREETGLEDARFIGEFKESLHYFFREKGRLISKTVVFFLGEVPAEAHVRLSSEHSCFVWLPLEAAVQRATFKNAKEMLRKAEEILNTG
ncbi:MAG: NUDIX domain-containing protein [Candidatus Micrarchaeota archaeon]